MLSKIMKLFSGVKSFFSGFLVQILGGLCVALILLCAYFYVENNINEGEISNLSLKIDELKTKNDVLSVQLANCKVQFRAVVEVKEAQQEALDKLNPEEQATLSQIGTLNNTDGKNEKDAPIDLSSDLPDDVRRLLSDHCKRTTGSVCGSPN